MSRIEPTIHELWVADGLSNHPSQAMPAVSYITLHTTGNRNPTATAESHARFQFNGGGGRQASWHYTVDMDEIWQSFRDDQVCWHTGTVRGNTNSIGIEICVNSHEGFKAACEKSAWLTAMLMEKHKLGFDGIVQHKDWSGKNCPRELISGEWGVSWEDFIAMVQGYYYGEEFRSQSQGQANPCPAAMPSTWAKTAWEWGTAYGITDGSNPRGSCTREQVVQLLFNYNARVINR